MPETEGRTLEDIEIHFSDNTKKITDIHIPKARKNYPVETEDGQVKCSSAKAHYNHALEHSHEEAWKNAIVKPQYSLISHDPS